VQSAILLSRRVYLPLLAVVFAAIWAVLAIAPHDRADWALENFLAFFAVLCLLVTARVLPLSRISYTLIFFFMCLHSVGAHYTYALVPYDDWTRWLPGGSLNAALGLERNHFDRVVHFLYGLLLVYPIREVFVRVADVRGFWSYFLPIDVAMSTSMMFELFEWGAAELFGGDLGIAYLGTQGDVWDAHKDMALASVGAVIGMTITAGVNLWLQRDFAREWMQSLKVKGAAPLGEDAITRLWRARSDSQL
jgi:putative membrane protein